MTNYCWKQDAINHAKECDPNESCGIIGLKENAEKYPVKDVKGKSVKYKNLNDQD